MRLLILTAAATLGLAATASAQAPTPVPESAMEPVSVGISILDAGGRTVSSLACQWTVPQDDDMPCIRFQGDPQTAFAAIADAGGVRAIQDVRTEEHGSVHVTYSKRADGTWLIRSRGEVDGRALHMGRVCTADGQHCAMWDARGARAAAKQIHAAAARLRS
jgi:hypothetical protein